MSGLFLSRETTELYDSRIDSVGPTSNASSVGTAAHAAAVLRSQTIVVVVFAVASLFLSIIILSTALALWYMRQGRSLIRRSSVRILLQVEAVSIPLSVLLLMRGTTHAKPGLACQIGPYFVVLLMTVISGLSSVIGINLVCVLIFGLSMEYEKWIYLAIYTLSIIAPTPSVLLGHYGYDPLRDDCWISLPAGVKRTLVTVCSGFLVPWIFATISVGSTIWIIVFLSKHRQINRLFLADGETNRTKVRRMILKVLLFPITNTFFILLLTICELVVDQQLISQNGGHKENGGLHFIIAIGAVMTALVLGIELLLVDPSFNLRVILDAFRKEEDLDECSSASQRSSEPRARVTSTMGRLALRIENTTSVEMDILETKSPVRAV